MKEQNELTSLLSRQHIREYKACVGMIEDSLLMEEESDEEMRTRQGKN